MNQFVSLTTMLAAIALARAQSIDSGLGTNLNAQGATEDVTPGSGPNG